MTATQADILADGSPEGLEVAADHATDTGTYSTALRQRIADVLGELRIAGPWGWSEDEWTRRHLGAEGNPAVVEVWVRSTSPGSVTVWNWSVLGPEGWAESVGDGLTEDSAKAAADAALLEAGWVLCPQPKQEQP